VILARVALLQQEPPALVHHEDRERAVQLPRPMDRVLAGRADGAVALVDQDELFINHVQGDQFGTNGLK
jgi:hypothetical protein